jgi:hypothetical protein
LTPGRGSSPKKAPATATAGTGMRTGTTTGTSGTTAKTTSTRPMTLIAIAAPAAQKTQQQLKPQSQSKQARTGSSSSSNKPQGSVRSVEPAALGATATGATAASAACSKATTADTKAPTQKHCTSCTYTEGAGQCEVCRHKKNRKRPAADPVATTTTAATTSVTGLSALQQGAPLSSAQGSGSSTGRGSRVRVALVLAPPIVRALRDAAASAAVLSMMRLTREEMRLQLSCKELYNSEAFKRNREHLDVGKQTANVPYHSPKKRKMVEGRPAPVHTRSKLSCSGSCSVVRQNC